MDLPVVSLGVPYHLPRVVDPGSAAIVSTECAEIGHAYAIRAGDEGMVLPVVSVGLPYHLPRVVDPVSVAKVSTECAKVGYFLAVKVNEKSTRSWARAEDANPIVRTAARIRLRSV